MTTSAPTSPAQHGMLEAANVTEFIALNVLCVMESQPELVFNPFRKPLEQLARECAERICPESVEQVLHGPQLDCNAERDTLALGVIVGQLEEMGAMLNPGMHDAFVDWIPDPKLLPH